MTAPRIIVPGATTAITRRTTLRKAFLGPWHPGVQQAWLYAMALAQRATDVALHHTGLVINHQHTTATPEHDNLPQFLRMLHGESSCAINTLLARERYDQPGDLFDKRATHLMRLCDAPAQSTHIVYEVVNTVAAGLVARPEHMPGHFFDFDLWLRGDLEVPRPDFYFSKSQPAVLKLRFTPPPLLYAAFDGDLPKLVHAMKRLAEHTARQLRAHSGREVLGAQRVRRLHPWSEPRTLRETRGHTIPSFRIGARGIVGQLQHIDAAVETRDYRLSYREALDARRDGDLDHAFPYGTYQMRLEHGVPVQPPPQAFTAIVTRPGPTLREVQAQLEQRSQRRQRGDAVPSEKARFELIDSTRSALDDEAELLCEQASDGMDFRSPPREVRAQEPDRGGEAPDGPQVPAVVRHRFDAPRLDGSERAARRVITLRDRRKGRPRAPRHGSDPPA